MGTDAQRTGSEKFSTPGVPRPAKKGASSFVPRGRYADSSLPTFLLAMYLNQNPLRAERDIVFVRHLSNVITQLTEAAADSQGLEAIRKLLWWNLTPIPPFAIWAFIIQQLCTTIANLAGKSPARIFTAKHSLTRGLQLPKWQHNPAWVSYMSGPHQEITEKEISSILTVEYTLCLHGALRILQAFVKYDFITEMENEEPMIETKRSDCKDAKPNRLGAHVLDFGDPRVTIFTSPAIFIFEACTSAFEISHVLMTHYPWAADRLIETAANALVITGIIDIYPRRLKAVMERVEDKGKGGLSEAATQLRPTAKEFCPAVKPEQPTSVRSLSSSAARAPILVPRTYSGARPPALHIDDFEAIYGKG
ncbi:MAG: hypothetical protein M1830_004232 [Pleopsidium flavum]|nr:MAG: hypothetical protein M1830_004232 [Pleopsidium flavum]